MSTPTVPQTDSTGQDTVTVPKAFVEAVRKMRTQQKAFFAGDRTVVQAAKVSERAVDQHLDSLAVPSLFS